MSPAFLIVLPLALRDPVSWGAIALGCGLYLFYRGFGFLQRQRLITNIPRSTVRGAAIGLVEVCGQAAGPYTLISPLAALDCLYYRAVAWQNDAHAWQKTAEECLCTPFFLNDGTGQLLVDPRGSKMDLAAAFSHEFTDSAFASDLVPVYIGEFIRRHGISADIPLKLEEYCILPGDTIFALGTLQQNAEGASAQRAGAGFVSPDAADLQRRGMLECLDPSFASASSLGRSPREISQSAAAAGEFDLQPPVALRNGSSGEPFFISWCSRREVATTLSWRAFLYLWCGPLFTVLGLWLLLRSLRGE